MAVMVVGGHTSSKTALRYHRAELVCQRALMDIQSQKIEEQGLGKAAAGKRASGNVGATP